MNNNTALLVALVNGDSKKIEHFYTKIFPMVRKFIFHNKGKTEDAEDIFQKALLQIAVRYKKEKFIINTNIDAYLFTVCKNLWRRELNKAHKKTSDNDLLEFISEEKDSALAIVEQKRQELFIEKLDQISRNCKQILTFFFAKTPYSEIVEYTDYNSETVVRQRVFKCKKKLTELIKKDVRYNSLREL